MYILALKELLLKRISGSKIKKKKGEILKCEILSSV
jgi:hypothetical protein